VISEKRRLGFSLYSVLIEVGPSSTATLADLSDRVTSVSQQTDAAVASPVRMGLARGRGVTEREGRV